MVIIVPDAACATFVNTFRCQPSDQEHIVGVNIEIVETVASLSAGFISASIHPSTDGTRVFNYLQWQTPQHLADMQRSAEFSQLAQQFRGLLDFDPHHVRVAHTSEVR
jgi:hypothetical protein